jgi:hypothetical protein
LKLATDGERKNKNLSRFFRTTLILHDEMSGGVFAARHFVVEAARHYCSVENKKIAV